MNIQQATRDYEAWLRQQTSVVDADLRLKHARMGESPFVFYPRYLGGILFKAWHFWSVYRRTRAMLTEIEAAPDRWTYTDLAIAPPLENEFEALDLYHATAGGEAALERKRRDEAIRAGAHAPVRPAVSLASP